MKKKLIFSSYLCEFLLLLIFLSNNFDFICNNNKQLYFVKMHPTMTSEYFFVSNSINKFVEVTTRDKQLLKFNKTCSILINLSSVYVNPNFLYKKKDSFTSFQIAAIVINFFKNQSFMQIFENFYTFFINLWEIDDWKHCLVFIYIE